MVTPEKVTAERNVGDHLVTCQKSHIWLVSELELQYHLGYT